MRQFRQTIYILRARRFARKQKQIGELVVDVIKDATDKFLSIKRHEHRVNPVVAIILELVEAACAELIRPIAVEVALFSTIITLLLIVIVNI
jgi:hypothetical protein